MSTTIPTRLRDLARERFDAMLAFDPGLNQLLIAAGVAAGVAASIGALYLFAQLAHPMWIEPPAGVRLPAAQAAQLGAQHHGETLLTMLLGGIVGMISAFAISDTDPRQLTITFALLPVPMLATLVIAVQFLHDRALGIVCMALVMGIGAYAPKFSSRIGPRAFVFGQMLFNGYLFGFLSNGAITTHDVGWVAAVLWVAAAVNLVLKLVVFLPLRRGALRRTVRAFFARGRGVIAGALALYETSDPRERARRARRLGARLNRLNEAALIADALLAEHASTAEEAHARLFGAELTLQNIGRLAAALVDAELPADVHRAIGDCLAHVLQTHGESVGDGLDVLRRYGDDPEVVRARPLEVGRVLRLADALVGFVLVLARWEREIEPERVRAEGEPGFQAPVALMFGNLPGSTLVSREAAAPPGSWRARLGLDLPAQAAIRLAIAVVAAAALGSVLSERRFYWAVLGVFVSFMGTSTSGEQVFKAINRVAGTVIGILIGSLLAHAIGDSTWSVLVVVVALGLGVYFMRASYALMVIGITITVSQLYVQLGEYSNHLLVLRLEETAIGAAIAAGAALLVFPLRTTRATRVAARGYYDLLGELLDGLIERLRDEQASSRPLSTLSRSLDAAAHQLRAAAAPLMLTPQRRDAVQHNMLLYGQASHHARNAVASLQLGVELGPEVRESSVQTLRAQRRLVGALAQLLEIALGPHGGSSIDEERRRVAALAQDARRSADLLGAALADHGTRAERRFLRHLARLDETLAELGDNLARGPGPGRSGPGLLGRPRPLAADGETAGASPG